MLALESSSTLNVTNEHLIDALPYFDTNFGEEERDFALKLIEAECKIYRPTKDYLRNYFEPDYDCYLTDILKNEMERMEKGLPMEKIDLSQYEKIYNSSTRFNDKQSVAKALSIQKSKLEHLQLRKINLEIMEDYGNEICLRYNKLLQENFNKEDIELNLSKAKLMEVHASRKRSHLEAGEKIQYLENNWVHLVTKTFHMKKEIDSLKGKLGCLKKKQKVDA
ncbi:Pre-mRNA-splicing factor SPF27 [Strongyloides ratti]|uniref:Pre-mRNA-splicing factor SPF27 n=1 Tax=Strongyloides ratti TaxID=34506 RepID=A0A090L7L9_STRRB|nr:Pre-mRNA-splicing factor SPF27 [Strongyloides ratti]CEF65702.1 Pre-mRNA-splicing factor SPF27 [Strongyloides ratti]